MGLSDNERTSEIARGIEAFLHSKQPGEVRVLCGWQRAVILYAGWGGLGWDSRGRLHVTAVKQRWVVVLLTRSVLFTAACPASSSAPCQVDSPEVLHIKTLIRRCEARSGEGELEVVSAPTHTLLWWILCCCESCLQGPAPPLACLLPQTALTSARAPAPPHLQRDAPAAQTCATCTS